MTRQSGPSVWKAPSPLPGFSLSLGFTLAYLSLFVLIPLAALAIRPWENGLDSVIAAVASPRAQAALRLSFIAAAVAAAVNAIMGGLLAPLGVKIAYTPIGVVIAMIFVGLPFVVRSIQPVLQDLDQEVEAAAETLGASQFQTAIRIILPALLPALLSGVGLAFARGVGEYGSVIFIAGNMPLRSEIAPLLIVTQLEQFNYAGAAATGLAMLCLSFFVLLSFNSLQTALARRGA